MATLLSNLPVALLVEGGIFLTLAMGIQYGRKRRRSAQSGDASE